MRKTPIKVLNQGSVKLSGGYGYSVYGDGDAVCFFFDVERRSYIVASSISDDECPVVYLSLQDNDEPCTEVEFSEFKGWQFHSGNDGKVISIALARYH